MKSFIDKKSKLLFSGFAVFVLLIFFLSFLKYFIFEDYYMKLRIECDPRIENCFVDDENESEVIYYKMIMMKVYNIPSCHREGTCPLLSCGNNTKCKEILCNASNTKNGLCSNQLTY